MGSNPKKKKETQNLPGYLPINQPSPKSLIPKIAGYIPCIPVYSYLARSSNISWK
jgi:hypothetical protein